MKVLVPKSVRAIRGATTVDVDDPDQITPRVHELVREVFARNELTNDDVISIIFSATSDIASMYPATAARELGIDQIPLFGTQELTVDTMLPRCIRLLAHVYTEKDATQISHVFLHEARKLRLDLVK